MMKARRVSVGLVIGAAFLLGGASCKPIVYYLEQVYKLYGKVTVAGSNGETPIGSVEVFVGDYQYSELTNYYGDYELELAKGTWTINFVKEGYEPVSAEVTVGPEPDARRIRLDMEMVPIPSAADGTISVLLTGANEHDGKKFMIAVFPAGERDPALVLGWDANEINDGAASNVALDSSSTEDPMPLMVFTGGESYDVIALLFAGDYPSPGDPYAEITGIMVDGDMVFTLAYPQDFTNFQGP
jgi:hypothetical protein